MVTLALFQQLFSTNTANMGITVLCSQLRILSDKVKYLIYSSGNKVKYLIYSSGNRYTNYNTWRFTNAKYIYIKTPKTWLVQYPPHNGTQNIHTTSPYLFSNFYFKLLFAHISDGSLTWRIQHSLLHRARVARTSVYEYCRYRECHSTHKMFEVINSPNDG